MAFENKQVLFLNIRFISEFLHFFQENNTWQLHIFDTFRPNATELSVFDQSGNRIAIR